MIFYLKVINNQSLVLSKERLLSKISKKSLKSEIKLQKGYLKVAGLFFSKKAWPIQAKA